MLAEALRTAESKYGFQRKSNSHLLPSLPLWARLGKDSYLSVISRYVLDCGFSTGDAASDVNSVDMLTVFLVLSRISD